LSFDISSSEPLSLEKSASESLSDEALSVETSASKSLSSSESFSAETPSESFSAETPSAESSSFEPLSDVANIEESSSEIIEQASESSIHVLEESNISSAVPIPATDESLQASEETLPELEDQDYALEEVQDSDEHLEDIEEAKFDFNKIDLNSDAPLPDLEELISNFEKNQPFNDNNVEDKLSALVENEAIVKANLPEKLMSEEAVPFAEPVGPVPIVEPINPDSQNLEKPGVDNETPVEDSPKIDNDAKENSDIKSEGLEEKLE
jgi:hypothetical protein